MRQVAPKLTLTAVIIGLFVHWILPQPMWGHNAFMITRGISMEPIIHQADLAILRDKNSYSVGDIVAYKDPNLGRVLHRIVGRHGEKFILQGDNNAFLDNYQPTEREIVGELWIQLPGAGKWLERAKKPVPMMLLAAIAGFLMLAPRKAVGRLRRRSHRPPSQRRKGQPDGTSAGGPAGILGPDGQTAITVVGALALISILVALLAFTRDTEQQSMTYENFEQHGTFSYSATATGNIYEDGTVTTGQPVYLELVDALDINFDYRLDTRLPASTSGSYRLDALVTFDEGLSRTIPLVPETIFEGTEFDTRARFDFSLARQYIDQVTSEIGADNGGERSHTIAIVPTISVSGTIANLAVADSFAPALEFELDSVALRMLNPAPAPGADGESASSPLKPVQAGLLERSTMEPAALSFLMIDLSVAKARQLALAGLVLSIVGGAALGWLYVSARQSPEPAQIQARYRLLLVKVNGSDLGINGADGHTIEVASIEDLARVAEREGRMILHQQTGNRHEYFVQDVDVTYSYVSMEAARARTLPAPEAEPSI